MRHDFCCESCVHISEQRIVNAWSHPNAHSMWSVIPVATDRASRLGDADSSWQVHEQPDSKHQDWRRWWEVPVTAGMGMRRRAVRAYFRLVKAFDD